MDKKRIVILGLSGSIGRQALDVIDESDEFEIVGAAVNKSTGFLESEIEKRAIPMACAGNADAARDMAARVGGAHKIYAGVSGMCDMIRDAAPDLVLNALGGMVGLCPTLAAIEAGCDVALANKETLVAGGTLVMDAAKKRGVKILPIDSEHSAIWQSLRSGARGELSRLILTASGGPFREFTKEQMERVTVSDALKHPNWSMGPKITIDSATMMNKGLEFIEAMHLFSVSPDEIEIIIHPESIIHSAAEFCDGAVIAELGTPDMRLPIAYAINYERRAALPVKRLSLSDAGRLTFYKPDFERFPCLGLARESAEKLGTATVVLNGANEAAVELFLNNKAGFTDIARLVCDALSAHEYIKAPSLDEILAADEKARRRVYAAAEKLKR
ncbi:MAG: 1-deoxy-D-xylulose-5-phosphate reductoisomerase [Clostridia bacterium]|nr:1-deoxy-D-xylulose-5-phosphate reductoisomerase [Clostridia bacterium]